MAALVLDELGVGGVGCADDSRTAGGTQESQREETKTGQTTPEKVKELKKQKVHWYERFSSPQELANTALIATSIGFIVFALGLIFSYAAISWQNKEIKQQQVAILERTKEEYGASYCEYKGTLFVKMPLDEYEKLKKSSGTHKVSEGSGILNMSMDKAVETWGDRWGARWETTKVAWAWK